MTKPNVAVLGFSIAAGLFLGVAVYGAVRGRFSATFLVVAVVFAVVALASRRKGGGPDGPSGAGGGSPP